MHESGFQVRRTAAPDFERLEQLHPADWDDMALYLVSLVPDRLETSLTSPPSQENIPSIPASSSLSTFLATLLGTQVQRIVLPPLFDPSNPPAELSNPYSENDQSAAFAQSQAAASGKEQRRRGRALPSGGGPFRGYAFVVVQSREDAERILKEWTWEEASNKAENGPEKMDEDDSPGKDVDTATLARKSGFRSLS